MIIAAIISFLFLCVVALLMFVTLVLPLLVWLGSALPVLVTGCFELVSSAISQGFVDAAIERKVKGGMTPEQAREAVEREREERARRDVSPVAVFLVGTAIVALILAAALVGDHLGVSGTVPSNQEWWSSRDSRLIHPCSSAEERFCCKGPDDPYGGVLGCWEDNAG